MRRETIPDSNLERGADKVLDRERGVDGEDATRNPRANGGHLRYLLTAYLFDSLSAEGRREVEAHLEVCPECSAEFKELRGTLDLLEESLEAGAAGDGRGSGRSDGSGAGGGPYSFEARRVERVLEASRRRPWRRRRLVYAVLSAAAMLLVGFLVIPWDTGTPRSLWEGEALVTGGFV
ncbi:MAG: zf-HC2 domain-containing protein, partial [Planctomycetota bacterium]|nr:zf-HC2 domain-containing protein [Planctomycetota bacterium]